MDNADPGIPAGNGPEPEKIREEIRKYLPIVKHDPVAKKWFEEELKPENLLELRDAVKFHQEWHTSLQDPYTVVDQSNKRHQTSRRGRRRNGGKQDRMVDQTSEALQTPLERLQALSEEAIFEREIRRRLSKTPFKKGGMPVWIMIRQGDCRTVPELHKAIVRLTGKSEQDAATFLDDVEHQIELALRFARMIGKGMDGNSS